MCLCAKFDQFLPVRSHFDTKRPVTFFHIATFQSATFGRPLFAFVLCDLRQKIIKKIAVVGIVTIIIVVVVVIVTVIIVAVIVIVTVIIVVVVVIYTTIGEACVCVCAKFDQFLPVRPHLDTKRPVNFFSHSNFPIPYLWTAFCVPLSFVFYEKQ